ncbi:glutaredoxin-C4 [Drosophila pseudoobscura]|uniref:Glutaredoxin-2, mitochondrial n=4 Tax=pseudoobscura subgroup TaxID=32358 RepID=Q2M0E0_DROPS|nr:glutaredoxin-C4 [Drosophila pseudoobscura]
MLSIIVRCLPIAHQRLSNQRSSPQSLSTQPVKFPFPLLDFDHMGSIGSSLRSQTIDMSSKSAKFVENTIASHKVVIFSKTFCPYCKMAKEPFQKLNVQATVIELDGNPDGDEIQTVLGTITGARTVPRVFIDGKFVGGGTDIKRMYDTGDLQKYFA